MLKRQEDIEYNINIVLARLKMKINLRKLNNPISWLISFGLSVVGLSVGFWLTLFHRPNLIGLLSERLNLSIAYMVILEIILIILLYLAPAIVVYCIFRRRLSSLGYIVGIITSGLAIYSYFVWLFLHELGGGP
jgi:hypothetical protein